MEIRFHRSFSREHAKLSKNDQERFGERLAAFTNDPFDPSLHNHTLKGKYRGCRSINITGDLRAIYTPQGDKVIFLEIGTHSKLYG